MNKKVEKKTLTEELTKEEVKTEILDIINQVASMGENDYEMPALYELITRLEKGECSSKDALNRAQKILDRKIAYSYH